MVSFFQKSTTPTLAGCLSVWWLSLVLVLVHLKCTCEAFVPITTSVLSSTKVQQQQQQQRSSVVVVFSESPGTKSKSVKEKQTSVLGEEEAPAGIVGADFFGGNKQKEEFYDPVAEEQAPELVNVGIATSYSRFCTDSFEEGICLDLAKSLQSQINVALYGRPEDLNGINIEYTYPTSSSSSSFQWTTPFKVSTTPEAMKNPLEALANSLEFYRYVDLAIVGGRQTGENSVQLEWELSLVWPNFWEPRVLLLGTSDIRLGSSSSSSTTTSAGSKIILQQTDTLLGGGGDNSNNNNNSLLDMISSQVKPRFWDWYHVGMTPSAELMPRLSVTKPLLGFSGYQVYEIPSRLMLVPTMLDTGDREDRNAQAIPNHAFSCVIKTMGPTRQRYVTTAPIEVKIIPGQERLKIRWNIPLSVQFQTNMELPIPGEDLEAEPGSSPECSYERVPRRKVATIQYGGNPQDPEITDIRKALYEKVTKDGLKPKLDENGRPNFFFLQNEVKACYTEEGLGMCVYEWRLQASKYNEVGIELEYS